MHAGALWGRIPRVDLEGPPPDVSSLCDVMGDEARLLGPGLRPVTRSRTVIGQAVTTQLSPGHNLGVHIALSVARPGDVLVVACAEPTGTIGGILAASAVRRGVAAIIADGWIRDLDEIRALDLPVWARGVSPRGAGKDSVVGVNVPVSVGGVEVRPGDVVVGDSDGLVVVPLAEASDVIARARDRATTNARILEQVRSSSETTISIFGLDAPGRPAREVVDDVWRP